MPRCEGDSADRASLPRRRVTQGQFRQATWAIAEVWEQPCAKDGIDGAVGQWQQADAAHNEYGASLVQPVGRPRTASQG
jgi:hypothetical protein